MSRPDTLLADDEPIVNPYHVALQASRGDVHMGARERQRQEVRDQAGRRRPHGRADEARGTVAFLQGKLGAELWKQGMNPDIPETKTLDNPFMYTEYHSASTRKAHELAEEE
jgi:hypothetical protein